jgi:two-component system CheB/CheR fusion protein
MCNSKFFTESSPEDHGNVLVVDDSDLSLELLSEILTREGFKAHPVKSGILALESVRRNTPDLILLDIMMPGMDGYEVCRLLKEDDRTRNVPVIFISTLEASAERVKGFAVGGVDFISKPFQAEEVLARVRTHLALRKTQIRLEKQKAQLEQEILERKNSDNALQESEARLQAILDNAPAVIYVKDTQGRYTLINRKFEELFHLRREHFIGKTNHDVFSRKVAETLTRNDRAVLESGRALQVEEQVGHEYGPLSFISVKFPLRNVEGETYAVCGISSDITKRKHGELALQQAKEAAEAANRAKSVFLASMSHELRTPLNVILGFSQLMQRDSSMSVRAKKHLETINRSGEHLLALINEVLEVSKIEAGRLALNNAAFDLYGLLEGIEAMFRMRAEQKRLRFSVEIPEGLPRYLAGDEGKLRQVLINLLGNAIKFTGEGSITLRVSVRRGTSATLFFEVEDTGAGIASKEMKKLFQPFEQTLSGHGKGGTGLGLKISREYARLMGGDLTARSEPSKGSVFTFSCRVEESREDLVEKIGECRRVVALAPNARPRTVLVVDDKEESRRFVAELLNLVGFATREAANGQEALALCEAERPDLVLMDMRMPVMDGYEATRRLKATGWGKKTPVIVISASALDEDQEEILGTGAEEFIRKPYRECDLFEAIGRLLGIEYRYADDGMPPAPAPDPAELVPGDLAKLPREFREALREALTALNVQAIREVIARIRTYDERLGEAMERLESDYQFEILLELVKNR